MRFRITPNCSNLCRTNRNILRCTAGGAGSAVGVSVAAGQRRRQKRRNRFMAEIPFAVYGLAESMQKKPHAKLAKDAKARQKRSFLQPNDDSPFGELFLQPAFLIPLRPSRTWREALLFELHGSGAAASEAGFNAGGSPARRIRLFTPENGADVAIARCDHGSPCRLNRPVAMKIN